MKKNKLQGVIIYFLIALLLIFGLVSVLNFAGGRSSNTAAKYSDVIAEFDDLNVSAFVLDLGSGRLNYVLKGGSIENQQDIKTYTVPNVSIFINDINAGYNKEGRIANYRQRYNEANPEAPLYENYIPISDNTFLTSILPYLLLVGVMVIFTVIVLRQTTGGGKMNTFSRANVRQQTGRKVTFEDVAGADEEKQELVEIVDYLKNPAKYREIGARVPKGVLLVGPPGTGKTLLAKAVAGEAGAPFFSISGSDFVEMYVGVGASRVRDLFDQAKKHTPSIIFIDEIDAVGRQRGAGLGGGHDEREQTLNQLLVEMDGFTENENIIVMAATNRRDILDPALLRPGRFDRQVVVSYPDIKGREEILKVHTRNKNIGPDVDLKTIAATTAGFTGADLENLVNEAALLAARNNRKAVTKADIEEATIKVVAGPEKKSRIVSPEDKRITAYHEAGHAVTTMFCPTQDKVHQVSIIQRGMAAGFTMHLPEKDNSHVTKNRMEESIVVLLGGRAAEKLILDDITTGASNDIERATSVARDMVTRYGFSEKLGPILYGSENDEVFLGRDYGHGKNYSENVASEIDAEIRELIETGYEKAKEILTVHGDLLERCAQYLIKHEKLDGPVFYKLMNNEIDIDGNPTKLVEEKSETAPETVPEETSEEKPESPDENQD
ncbi:MAG: ATP-dependent zinc metalloprotease FtsH [Lachnospiraceae bacterium]|nr:ATP-dependent zinc metalloprotease FtsH [Ruminococcus sp.]MCM1273955.1 ATP-dependent zinc metalloprotease FtsH [Lachnospiraceae bacterium]